MHLGVEAMRRRELGEEGGEGLLLRGVEGAEHVGVLPGGGRAQRAEHLPPVVREVEPVVPAVLRVPRPRDEARTLEGVDEHDDATRHGAEAIGKCALAQPGLPGDDPEDPRGRRGEPLGLDQLGEARGREGAQLRQEESGALRPSCVIHPASIAWLTESFTLCIIIVMTESTRAAEAPHRRRSGGPPLGPLAIVTLALAVAGVLVLTLVTGSPPDPFAAPAEVAAWYAGHDLAIRVGAMLQFGAAVPFGILTASLYARQLRLGVRVPGPVIGLYGGIAASVLLAASALVTWSLAMPGIDAEPVVAAALARLAFGLGGVGYATGVGLLVAGVAVPAFILRFLPRWLAVIGLVIGLAGELSFLSLVFDPLQALLPVVRFGGGIWLIAAAFLLPVQRARRAPGSREE